MRVKVEPETAFVGNKFVYIFLHFTLYKKKCMIHKNVPSYVLVNIIFTQKHILDYTRITYQYVQILRSRKVSCA